MSPVPSGTASLLGLRHVCLGGVRLLQRGPTQQPASCPVTAHLPPEPEQASSPTSASPSGVPVKSETVTRDALASPGDSGLLGSPQKLLLRGPGGLRMLPGSVDAAGPVAKLRQPLSQMMGHRASLDQYWLPAALE